MKQEIILLSMVMIVVLSFPAFSQVSINTDGTDPDASAMLDVKSTEGGMLVPRMTQAERNNINGGVFETGLLIYQTDNTPGFYYYDGSTWQNIVGGDDGDWTTDGNNIYSAVSGNVGIGSVNPTHKLEITNSIDKYALRLVGPLDSYGYGARLSFGDAEYVYIEEDNDDRLLIYSDHRTALMGGNVGIGTIYPTNKLEVLGNTFLDGDVNIGTANSIKNLQVSGNTVLNGSVGIGTSTPTHPLEVIGNTKLNGNIQITGGSPADGKVLTSDADGNASWQNFPRVHSASIGYPQYFPDDDNWKTVIQFTQEINSDCLRFDGNLALALTEGSGTDSFYIRFAAENQSGLGLYFEEIKYTPDEGSSNHDNFQMIPLIYVKKNNNNYNWTGEWVFMIEVRNTGDDGWVTQDIWLVVTEY